MIAAPAHRFAEPPVLETARLRLRAPVMADFTDFAAFFASDRARYMGGTRDEEVIWSYFTNDTAQWRLLGLGGLMIERREGGPAIGQVMVCHGPLFPEPELGWFLYDGHERQGYVDEAARALRDWAFGPRGLETLVSYVDPANTRSARVAERLGAVLDADAARPAIWADQDPPDLVYRHSPGDA